MSQTSLASGVLAIRGNDRRGVLQHALEFLAEKPVGLKGEHQPADVDLASVRGVGPFGGVLLRFVTNADTLKALSSPVEGDALWELKRRLNEGLMPNEVAEKGMEAFCFPVLERFDSDESPTRAIVVRSGYDPRGESLLGFLRELAKDERIDIASYDRVITDPDTLNVTEGWRIYDLQGRESAWLEDFLEDANLQAEPHRRMGLRRFEFEDFSEYVDATLQLSNVHFRDEHRGWLYFQVHCRDTRTLFDHLHRFVRNGPGIDGPLANRLIVRSYCAGIGGQALAVIAARGRAEEKELLERQLEQSLQRLCGESHMPKAQVSYSDKPPTLVGDKAGQEFVAVEFVGENNEPGALQRIIQAAAAISIANASVYYLSARLKNSWSSSRSKHFDCAIGWVVEKGTRQLLLNAINPLIVPLCSVNKPPVYHPEIESEGMCEKKPETPTGSNLST